MRITQDNYRTMLSGFLAPPGMTTVYVFEVFSYLRNHYDTGKNTGNEGPFSCPKEVSLTLKTDDIKFQRKSSFR